MHLHNKLCSIENIVKMQLTISSANTEQHKKIKGVLMNNKNQIIILNCYINEVIAYFHNLLAHSESSKFYNTIRKLLYSQKLKI